MTCELCDILKSEIEVLKSKLQDRIQSYDELRRESNDKVSKIRKLDQENTKLKDLLKACFDYIMFGE